MRASSLSRAKLILRLRRGPRDRSSPSVGHPQRDGLDRRRALQKPRRPMRMPVSVIRHSGSRRGSPVSEYVRVPWKYLVSGSPSGELAAFDLTYREA